MQNAPMEMSILMRFVFRKQSIHFDCRSFKQSIVLISLWLIGWLITLGSGCGHSREVWRDGVHQVPVIVAQYLAPPHLLTS
jgi:hypothetical protein